MFRINPSQQALDAIESNAEYLVGFADDSDIVKVLTKIREAIQALSQIPTRHRLYRPPIAGRTIRCAPAGKYVVYFEADEVAQVVGVIDVQHRRRDPSVVRNRLQ